MNEFGSDFHKIEYPVGNGLPYRIFNCYVSGRQALLDVVLTFGYRRIWIPSYYCGESIKVIESLDVEIKRYNCLPTDNPDKAVENLPLSSEDLLLRVNFFGLHGFHNSNTYCCDVIEDHTHDLQGEWALNSNARWCFASIRKTLPTPDGGVLWSASEEKLPEQRKRVETVSQIIEYRYSAMEAKRDYLFNQSNDKDKFLSIFRITEDWFGKFKLSDCSSVTKFIIDSIDVETWYNLKSKNYHELLSSLKFNCSVPVICRSNNSTPFSLIIIFNSNKLREKARQQLILNSVYPAVLWSDVYEKDIKSINFSERMLSIHCDGRYTEDDIRNLSRILNTVL